MTQELLHKQHVYNYLRVFIKGGSVTCNADALTGAQIKALEYLEGEGICTATPPPPLDNAVIACPRCSGKGRTVDDIDRLLAVDKKAKPQDALCARCGGVGSVQHELDPNDASGRYRAVPEKIEDAKKKLIHFEREIRQQIAKGR